MQFYVQFGLEITSTKLYFQKIRNGAVRHMFLCMTVITGHMGSHWKHTIVIFRMSINMGQFFVWWGTGRGLRDGDGGRDKIQATLISQ